MYKKGLVLSVIFLFVAVSFQPVLAVNVKPSVINNFSEECKECQEVNKRDLIYMVRLLNWIGIYSKLLLVLIRCNPEFKRINKELSNEISISLGLSEELKSYVQYQEHPICDILEPFRLNFYLAFTALAYIGFLSPLLLLILLPILCVMSVFLIFLDHIMEKLGCNILP